jgi:hypothetical protein
VVREIKDAAARAGEPRVKTRMREFDEPVYYVIVASFVESEKASVAPSN